MSASIENFDIAARLRQAAELLQAQGANPFRVAAYRRAADSVEACTQSVAELHAREGEAGIDALPGVGHGISAAIAEMLRSGRWNLLDRLRGELDPVRLFQTVPGIGPGLALRLHEALAVDTLEGLEAACHDGRVARVPGVGERRAAAISGALAQLLQRTRVRQYLPPPPLQPSADGSGARPAGAPGPGPGHVPGLPPVSMLLDVDREYRDKAQAGALPTIAPRRFNPAGEAWLPVLHTARGDWHFTALFSNTARAHELGRTHDWVVLYFYDDQHVERQCTVVTESRGVLAGERVVRGREAECRDSARSGNGRR